MSIGDNCSGGWEAHEAHIGLNGECPWCGAVDETVSPGHIDELTGTVYDGEGRIIEHGRTR